MMGFLHWLVTLAPRINPTVISDHSEAVYSHPETASSESEENGAPWN